nr:hypothetical protein [Tanacetum cinerariifolium]
MGMHFVQVTREKRLLPWWRCGGEDGRAAAVVLAVGDRRSSEKWRRCMASVGGGLDRSGEWKYFWVRQKNSPEKLSGDGRGGGRRRPAGGRQRLPKCGREKWE